MSILVKPYEISIWEDIWDSNNEKFVEKKLLTIGSHLMKSQNRALNPNFVTNVNGTKKLSFQMYKQYRDDVTGEKVNNPFYPYLVNERKVKLKYKDEWHDFIIKNVSETSTTYLYSYQLEDAFVNELSKNGFNVELSAKEHSNLGTANELADRVLEGTDWSVSDESEAFVQKNEEALVYLKTTTPISCSKILDNEDNDYLKQGVKTSGNVTIPSGAVVLAFYSCCKDKPHRFQFIYPVTGLAVNDRRLITNKERQYFKEYNNINSAYTTTNDGYQFVVPKDFTFAQDDSEENILVSSKYRAERYVYTPKTKYFSLLDRYMQEYTKGGTTYYGYEQTDYIAPTLITNLIDNTEFTSTSGWVAGITGESEIKPVIENKYGRWEGESFVTIQDDWKNQIFSETIENQRRACLYITAGSKEIEETTTYFPGHIINSGFYSNRVSLGKITEGESFILRLKMRNPTGGYIQNPANYLTPYLKNINYNTTNGYQILGTEYATFDAWKYNEEDNYCSCKMTVGAVAKDLTDKQFRNLKVKLGFSIPETSGFYIEDAQLFKYIPNGTGYLTPSDQSTEAVINKTYKFYKESDLNTITSLDELPVENCISLDYNTYKPVYSSGAQKVRTIDTKESNYFNILQSIAEKFEAWLRIKVGHDSYGRPTTKEILFKNYVGKDNHAGFRYGVNLKGIERQNNAQQLATKLIVKNNQNEHAENKTCSISNAPSNESGENYLYNFDYYVTQGLLNARELDAYLYDDGTYVNDYWAKKFGENVNSGEVGYYTYLKFLNNFIQEKNKQLVPLQVSQNSLIASKTLAEEGKSAAIDELEAAYSNFEDIAQVSYPVFTGAVQEADPPPATVECEIVASYSSEVTTTNIDKLLCPEGIDWEGLSFNTDNTVHMMIWENDNFIPSPSNPTLALPLFENNQVVTTFAYQSPATVDTSYVAIAPSITASAGGALYNTSMAYGFVNGNLSMVSSVVPKARTFARTTTTAENGSSTLNLWLSAKGSVSYEVPVGTSITGISINGIALGTSEFTYDNGLLSIDLTWESWEALGMGQGVIGDRGTFNLTISLEKIVEYSVGSTKYEELVKREDIQELLQEITTLLSAKRTHNENFIDYEEKLDSLQLQINNLKAAIDSAITEKKIINQQFYAKYHRFIQEGTWVDEQYIDPELYYVDAQSVLYESCYPAITYTINLLELSQLEGYELYSYELGDKTFAEDEEFFGEEKRVEVIVTEISNKLDSPEQNTIKTQTYKNQFQDLFQKITATVQQAQYNTGAYKKAAGMVEASEARKQEYLEGAISDLATLLTNAGEATVEQTNTGIIIKEKGNSGNQLKLTGGALMFGQFDDETGEMTWKSGLSTKGMAAEMITSGKLNTGALQIMNGNEAVFRWDALGISAFDYQTDANGNYTSRPNANKFIRFDKNGLYGISNSNISGVTWKPGSGDVSAEEDIKTNAVFKLTWDGLSLTPQNTIYTYKDKDTGQDVLVDTAKLKVNAKLGKVDNHIYNDWDTNGFPVYINDEAHKTAPKFVKVFAVGDKVSNEHTNEQFVLYSDGTIGLNNIKLTGDIQWTAASSPSKNVYGKTDASKPDNGTLYNKFPDDDSTETPDNPNTTIIENSPWHKVYNQEKDLYYCHTDDGGTTWQGPFLITGQSIIDTETEYIIADTGLSVTALNSLTGWSKDYPTEKPSSLQCIYIRIRDKYNSGEFSAWRYMSGVSPIGDFELTASELVIKEDQNVKLTPETITLTANCINLPSGGYYKFALLTKENEEGEKWESIQGNGGPANQRTLEAKRIITSGRIKATYTVGTEELASDEIVINRVKEGSDAISVILTNPSMVFNELDSNATESTKVRVFRGDKELGLYDSDNPSDWTYQLISSGTKISVSGDKFTVKNPGKATTFQVQIKIYKTKNNDTGDYDTITYKANINCNIINNNIQISLSNDVAVVGTKADGTLESTAAWNSALAFATENTVSVFKEGKDVTSDYTFDWSIKNANTKLGIIPKTENDWKTIYLKIPEDDGEEIDEPFGGDDTIIVQVEVKKGTQTIGTKEFKISKNYQGESAVSYRLIVTPNSWNISDTASQSLQFSMVKSTGSTPENIPINDNTTGYWIAIKATLDGKQGWMKITSESITETSTFALIEGVDVEEGKLYDASELEILDEETVTAVRNGTKGDTGNAGDTIGTITIYCSTENTTSPSKPNTTDTIPSGWSSTEITPDKTKNILYVWLSTGSFKTTAEKKTTYSNWTTPVLYSAYNDYGIDSKKYAEYLAATNFEQKKTIKYGADGELYINASYINTGALTVKSGGLGANATGSEILFAGLGENGSAAVRLAGWNVNSTSLMKDNVGIYSADQTTSTMICNHEKKDWRFVAGSNFGVDKNGKLYCANAKISGNVTASSGSFGNLQIIQYTEDNKTKAYVGFEQGVSNNYGDKYLNSLRIDDNGVQYMVGGAEGGSSYKITDSGFIAQASATNSAFGGFTAIRHDYLQQADLIQVVGTTNYYNQVRVTGSRIVFSNNTGPTGTHSPSVSYDVEIQAIKTDSGVQYDKDFKDIQFSIAGNKTVKVSELVGLNSSVSALSSRVDELGFKGPYTIKVSGNDTVVGKVCKLGNFVCGYLKSKAYSGCIPKDQLLVISGTLPGPAENHSGSITWFSNDTHNPNGRQVDFRKNSSGNLELYVCPDSKDNNDGIYDVGDADGGLVHWSYFCYTTNANTPIN